MFSLGFYLIQNLQWYNYKITRVLVNHKKKSWHILYFFMPVLLYYVVYTIFAYSFYLLYLPILFLWYKDQDKKLVVTGRVKRFFAVLLIFTSFFAYLKLVGHFDIYSVITPLILSVLVSKLIEYILFLGYKKKAKKKLDSKPNLKIIAITASYGKTSIKNFLYKILKSKYKTQMTPRSVNTDVGIIQDINQNLRDDTEIYIAEAGARKNNDILKISNLLNQNYAVLGQVGTAHIEYFKSEENIIEAKSKILASSKLTKAYVHKSAIKNQVNHQKLDIYSDKVTDIDSSLDGLSFCLDINGKKEKFDTNLLGSFNAENLACAILLAVELGVELSIIKDIVSKIPPVEHRLQVISKTPKYIIDDSYNGNIDGMIKSYELIKQYNGKKIIVTPGIIEGNETLNVELALKIDEVFDLVIITGTQNKTILNRTINKEKIILKDKANLEEVLKQETNEGDLVLFSNDAPTFC